MMLAPAIRRLPQTLCKNRARPWPKAATQSGLDSEKFGDHQRRQRNGEVLYEVTILLLCEPFHQFGGEHGNPILYPRDRFRERPAEDLADARMPRRIGTQQR